MFTEDTLLGKEEYKQHARQIAKKHGLISNSEMRIEASILECETQFENIRQIYKELIHDSKLSGGKSGRGIPAANLLIENYYIILSKMNDIKSVMNGSGINSLPDRIGYIAAEMTAHSDCLIDENKIFDFITSYQEIVYLTSDEIWWLGSMLKMKLINRISDISNAVYEIKRQRDIAERIGNMKNAGKILSRDPKKESSLIEHFSYKMKSDSESYMKFKAAVDKKYEALDLTLDELIEFENDKQISMRVTLSNAISSLRELDSIDFQRLFERLSHLEEILTKDPSGVYSKMDSLSKDYYRKTIVKTAKKENVSEFFVAKKALEKAEKENEHIGRYIIKNNKDQGREIMSYKAAILSATVAGTFFAALYAHTRSSGVNWVPAIIAALLTFPVFFEIFTQIVQKSFTSMLKPVMLPRLDFKGSIPKEYSVMVIIPTLLSSEKRVEELYVQIEAMYSVNGGENIYFAIVGDLSDSEGEILDNDSEIDAKGRELVRKLNERYGKDIFYFYLRKRIYNEKQNRWLGYERKRGAIIDFNNFLKSSIDMPYIKYVITLDADTKLTVGAVSKLAGTAAHPLNRPVVDEKLGRVTEGYGVFQTGISTELESARKNLFTMIFAGQGGMDTYSVRITDLYMDMCGEGIYTGKGIYDLDVFNKLLEEAIPDNLVLSHDLLEGSYLRTGFINDIQMIDSFPAKFNSYAMRLHRWVRGDWQIIKWLFPKVKNKKGEKVKNPLSSTSKWKIFDNLRRSWTDPALFLLFTAGSFILPGNKLLWIIIALTAVFAMPIISIGETLVNTFNNPQNKRYFTYSHVISGLQAIWLQKIISFSFLPYMACLMIGAVFKTLYRLTISKKKMLEWVTAADMENILKGNLASYLFMMKSCIAAGILMFLSGNTVIYVVGFIWLAGPFIAWYISKPFIKTDRKAKLTTEDMELLKEDAYRIWKFYENFVVQIDNYLPPDNVQFDPVFNVAHRTSPTNIGFYLMSVIAALDLKFITEQDALERIENTLNTLNRMEKWNGHLYNWYDTMHLIPLRPYYVSTVDSGNLQGYLMTVSVALAGMCNEESIRLSEKCRAIADGMDFRPLYNEERNLFSIGFNIDDGRLTKSHYDLLVSEARQTSYISIATRTVPEKHWGYLGRRPVTVKGHIGLASWTGTAFEFLMPNLIMKSYEASILDEALLTCVLAQIDYVKSRIRPWGISESGFYEFDLNLNYQYKAFGIPRLGLKKGLGDEFVVAPYGSILALTFTPEKVVENLKILKAMGAYGDYGYYEAIDYTSARTMGEKYKIVKSYMAHHLGMSLISIHNFLYDDLMKKRFHSIPCIKATEYLLCERVPVSGTPQNDTVTGDFRVKVKVAEKNDKNIYTKSFVGLPGQGKLPSCGIISNGRYSLFINNMGIGYSKLYDKLLASWNFDGKEYSGGFYCYIRNIDNGICFSPTALPDSEIPDSELVSLKRPDKYEFSTGGEIILFNRWDDLLETITEITIATEHNVEIRKTTVINHSETELILEINAGISFALASPADYMAHPVYNNLFITSEFISSCDLVIGTKKPKEEGKPYIYGFCAFPMNSGKNLTESIGDMQCETAGERVLMKRKVKVCAGATLEFSFITGISDSREEALRIADIYDDFPNAERAFELSKYKTGLEIEEFALNILPHLFWHSGEKMHFLNDISSCQVSRNDLWAFGISLDNPVILSFIDASHGEEWVEKLLQTIRYFDMKGLVCDLVFISEEPAGYLQPVYDMLCRLNGGSRAQILRGSEISPELKKGLITFASVIFNNEIYDIGRFEKSPDFIGNIQYSNKYESSKINIDKYGEKLFDNGTGFFVKDSEITGKEEYLIYNKPPSPWINVIASPTFGFTIDSVGQGCTWADNSRENRLTPWHNNIFHSRPTEEIYVENCETGEIYGLFGSKTAHITRHGIGYSIFEFPLESIDIILKITCDFKKPVKVINIFAKNKSDKKTELRFHYEAQPVLGVSPVKTFRHLYCERAEEEKGIIIRNVLPENVYGSNENLMFYTTARDITLQPEGEGETVLIMGKARGREEAKGYLKFEKYVPEMTAEKYYSQMIEKVRVLFNNDACDLMFGGRLLYQAISCRMYGRTAFYQSGGAFGFRDQLQDSLAMIPYDSIITRNQILLCCRHQFVEGDVQHWWHEPDGKGIRSRYSDDLLWLPYVASEYLTGTGDWDILTVCEHFLESKILDEDEKERYELPVVSLQKGTVYVHCVKAIEHAMKFGIHGLPLMGGGDWNDGMNEVGGDKGESVWLAWFLLSIVNRFVDVADRVGDTEKKDMFLNEVKRLISVIDEQAYDGSWYRRAYFDSGEPLGSAVCSECAIDSISQSWGAIAFSEILKSQIRRGETIIDENLKGIYVEHLIKAMDSVEKYLVDYNIGVVKLLTPPFVKSHPNPGYIMGYVAGVRENGGQYTHASVWYVKGLICMSEIIPSQKEEYLEKAYRILNLLNPVNHTRTPLEVSVYRVEPYVVAADVYADPEGKIAGRGGWTWYTGAAGWMQRIAEELNGKI